MRRFYVLMLPAVWAITTVVSYRHPGDEYALFVIGSLAGTWVCALIPHIGHLRDVLWLVIVAGVAVLALAGFGMDRLRISRRTWGFLFLLCFVLLFAISIRAYPSLPRAIRKNGSITAYAAAACNMGLCLSIMLAFIAQGIVTVVRKCRPVSVGTGVPGDG